MKHDCFFWKVQDKFSQTVKYSEKRGEICLFLCGYKLSIKYALKMFFFFGSYNLRLKYALLPRSKFWY